MPSFPCATILLAALLWAGAATAESRIALVIGNSAYADSPLTNPVNDAKLISAALRARGFEVIERLDVGQNAMKRAVQDFGHRLDSAQGDAVALFYYAGHGVQVAGENYLIPIGAAIHNEGDVDIEAVRASAILNTIAYARSRLNIVILDACRNNPFARSFRAPVRGLARMSAPSGTLIAYSTAPGQVALDGEGANSPYTAALARAIAGPAEPLELLFRRVRVAVLESTLGKQEPWEASSLTGDFYFAPVAVVAPDDRAIELAFWETIKDSRDAGDFAAYLEQFPAGTFAALARNRIEQLGETEVAVVTPLPEPAPEVEPQDSLLVALRNANLRAGPSTDFDQVGRLSAGQEVTVTGKVRGRDWYRIALADGGEAYVWAPLVGEPTAPAPPFDGALLAALTDEVAQRQQELTDVQSTIDHLQRSEALAREELTILTSLYEKGITSRMELLRLEREISDIAAQLATARGSVSRLRFAINEAQERMAEFRRVAVVTPPPAPAYAPGDTFRDCPSCPQMVVIPPGSFRMGLTESDISRLTSDEGGRREWYTKELPLHRVTIDRAFAVGKYEVSFAEWDACVSAGGCGRQPTDRGWGRGNRPVINVSWDDAQEYVAWLSGMTGQRYRLPSEAEWEYAARAGTRTMRYWGDTIGHDRANCDGCGNRSDEKQTAPAGSFAANGFGLHDMLGNVSEWTEDCYHDSYSGAPGHAVAWEGSSGCERALRGGAWVDIPRIVRAAVRFAFDAGDRSDSVGFRVARTLF